MEAYIKDKTYERENKLLKSEYENCTFQNCDFSNNDFSHYKFIDCTFQNCNLSLLKCNQTSFRDVQFIKSKMLGFRFDTCNEFGLSFNFQECQLNHSSFYKTIIKKTSFKDSQMEEIDFVQCNLSGSIFDNCNLMLSMFDQSNLEKVDFRTSYNYSLDPENNKIIGAKFSTAGIQGLLRKYKIEID